MVPGKLYPTNYPNGLSTTGEPNQGLVGNFSTIVTLTAAQMLAFNNNINTSALLIPTLPVENQSSVGNVIVIRNIYMELTSNGTAYTNVANNADLIFHYATGVNRIAYQIAVANALLVLGQTVPTGAMMIPTVTEQAPFLVNSANSSLYMNVVAGQYAAGTSPVKLFIDYSVIAL